METEQETSIRLFEKESDFFACEALQKETWGKDIEEVVTASLMRIVQKIGGIAAGAFDPDGDMAGFIFGFTGFRDGKPVHWSHMLAVKSAFRDTGIGRRLKLFQREILLRMGVEEVFWTYDPLAGKNGHFNLNSLGAEVLEYVPDMYGSGEDSVLFRGIGTDRFVVVWRIKQEKVNEVLAKKRFFDIEPFVKSPLAVCRVNGGDSSSLPVIALGILDARLRIEVPPEVHNLMNLNLTVAADWRKKTREAFQLYMKKDYRVVGLYVDQVAGRCFYCMERAE